MSAATDEVKFDAPPTAKKSARKPAKKKAKKRTTSAAPPKPAKSSVPFLGMTRSACAEFCGATGCAIGTSYCAHPCKGGLQANDMSNPKLLKSMQAARAQLQVKIDPDRFS